MAKHKDVIELKTIGTNPVNENHAGNGSKPFTAPFMVYTNLQKVDQYG